MTSETTTCRVNIADILLPLDVWRRLAARCARSLTAASLFHGPAAGLRQLQDAIVSIAVARGIRCEQSQVLVLASAQEAMELACRMLLDPGDEAWVLEDDYDSEFRYADRPLTALKGLDRAGRVLYAGTFNKTLFPALRLAYLILPEALIDTFRHARGIGGQHATVPVLR